MASKPKIVLAKDVYDRLSRLIDSVPDDIITEQLAEELARAKVVTPKKLPDNVVTMHSQVTFTVQSTGKTFTYTLVYPAELTNTVDQLSILSPIGSAIIGLQEGHEIDWAINDAQRTKIKVEKVLPETEQITE